jgi:PleD family two-component response regulator
MKTSTGSVKKPLNVLLIGNNPIEVDHIYSRLKTFSNPGFKTDVAFDINNIFRRIRKFRPYTLLIDDRFNKVQLNRLIKRIHRNPKTMDIPITLIKTSNRELGIAADVDNYILKENLTAEALKMAVMSSKRLRKTSRYLYRSYKTSLGFLQKLFLDLRKMYWFTEKL